MVALLLTVEATTTPVFTNLGGLAETNEESIIVPRLEGIHCVTQWWGGQSQALPQLGRHPIGQGRPCTHRSLCQRVAVSGSGPPALMGVSIWQRWTVGTMYLSGHHSPPAPTVPSIGPKGWCGAGPSSEPP